MKAARDDSAGAKRKSYSPLCDNSNSSLKRQRFTNDSLEESDNWPDLSDDILDEKNSLASDIFGTESPLLSKKKPSGKDGVGCIWTDSGYSHLITHIHHGEQVGGIRGIKGSKDRH